MSEVGKNIARRRKALGITQEELAKKMGYKSKSTINKIELGINDVVQSKVVKFAEVLETTPSVLMGWQEMQKKNSILTDLTIRMRTDDEFADLMKGISQLDPVQLASVKQVVDAFLSMKGWCSFATAEKQSQAVLHLRCLIDC